MNRGGAVRQTITCRCTIHGRLLSRESFNQHFPNLGQNATRASEKVAAPSSWSRPEHGQYITLTLFKSIQIRGRQGARFIRIYTRSIPLQHHRDVFRWTNAHDHRPQGRDRPVARPRTDSLEYQCMLSSPGDDKRHVRTLRWRSAIGGREWQDDNHK